jgi:hypothetical protein
MGAEKLLGMGDRLFKSNTGAEKRIHGAFVSDQKFLLGQLLEKAPNLIKGGYSGIWW